MFCTECGSKLDSSAKFCCGCGNAILRNDGLPTATPASQFAAPTTAQISTTSTSIVIEMESQPFLLKLGKIQVLLDDQIINSDLWFGKTMEFQLSEPGQHTLQIALKSVLTRSSEKISFHISSGQTLKFDGIYSNFGGGVSLVQI
jgi:hypothetical protein